MAVKSSNKLLPIIVGALVLVVFLVFSKKSGDSDISTLEAFPPTGSPEADTPADTIRTLTATVAELKRNNDKLSGEAKKLLSQQEQVESNVLQKLRGQIQADNLANNSALNVPYESLLSKYNQLEQQIGSIGSSDIPVGVGLDEFSMSEDEWIQPVSSSPDEDEKFKFPTGFQNNSSEKGFLDGIPSKLSSPEPDTVPRYTVPRNSTLIGSLTMTALIGRVPTDGTVEDPYPFKVIVGKDNLAANGLQIPGIQSMIFSGKAIGDWTLSCVRGEMDSVTYVFEDGTIKTLSSDDGSLNSGGNSEKDSSSLAWISDERGIPCVSGKAISNATSFLLARVAAKGFEAGAKAVADAETTTTVSNVTGAAATNITGSAVKNAGYETLSGGASELGEWLQDRQSQTYDVIYVDPAVKVALHITVELPIDYETKGRRLTYGNQTKAFYSATLD